MEKHRFNNFPEASGEEYEILVADMKTQGYAESIYIYENAILTGWDIYKASLELNISPSFKVFAGTHYEAICFMNRRIAHREFSSQQRAAILAMNDEVISILREQIKKEQRERRIAKHNASLKTPEAEKTRYEITINLKFQNLLPPLTQEELNQLEESILAEGLREPIRVWRGIVLDGHDSFLICEKYGIKPIIETLDLPDENAALEWICKNQLGRRDLHRSVRTLCIGRLYILRKEKHGKN